MKHSVLAAFALTAALASSAAAQSLGTSWSSTLFGCDGVRSCHRAIFNMGPEEDGFGQRGTVAWQSWFFIPGVVPVMWVFPIESSFEFAGENHTYSWYDEGTQNFYVSSNAWRPTGVLVFLSYGKLGGQFPEEDSSGRTSLSLVSTTTTTPEPASLLLLATGLGGLAAGAGRRRRQTGARDEMP
jgi:hypothetical protein